MSDNTTQKWTAHAFRVSLLNLFLLFIALLQGSSQLLGFLSSPENISESPFLKVWLSIGTNISENWVAVSIFLIIMVLACRLYDALSLRVLPPHSRLRSVGLLFINLAFCLRVYSSSSIFDKVAYLDAHLPTAIIVLIIFLFVTAVTWVIRRERMNSKDLEELIQKATNKPEDKAAPEGQTTGNKDTTTDLLYDAETAFRLKHPFSYAYRSFAKDWEKKREIKREYKKQLLQIKAKAEQQKKDTELKNLQEKRYTPTSKMENIVGYLSVILSVAICAVLVVFLSSRSENSEGIVIIQQITNCILSITGSLDTAKGPLTNFLLSSGILFLFVILILTIFLLVYTSLRVLAYLWTHPAEDTARIHRVGKAIKTFVLNILDGALRPLLFLPDFLKCVENMLLDVDIDEKIDEIYPPVELPPTLSEPSTPGGNSPANPTEQLDQPDSPEPSE